MPAENVFEAYRTIKRLKEHVNVYAIKDSIENIGIGIETDNGEIIYKKALFFPEGPESPDDRRVGPDYRERYVLGLVRTLSCCIRKETGVNVTCQDKDLIEIKDILEPITPAEMGHFLEMFRNLRTLA